jgi:hypothetical protein
MATLFPKTIQYLRKTGAYVLGVWTPAPDTPATFVGSVQTVSGKDLETLPVGRRDKGQVKVYSNSPLKVSKEGTADSGDIVIWRNQYWELWQELDYHNSLIEHFKYMGQYMGDVA